MCLRKPSTVSVNETMGRHIDRPVQMRRLETVSRHADRSLQKHRKSYLLNLLQRAKLLMFQNQVVSD